jgi:sulfur carrier protein
MSLQVLVNGQAREIAAGSTVDQVVAAVTDQACGIAVAVNGQVVPRRGWPATPVADGDHLEIVTAVQGG